MWPWVEIAVADGAYGPRPECYAGCGQALGDLPVPGFGLYGMAWLRGW
jgi:hypothetical protein